MRIAVAATFTADPIVDSIRFWARELDLDASVEIAPYNQVFQQLLDPSSLFATNVGGVNVVLVRPEDWERSDEHPGPLGPLAAESAKRSEGHVQDLARAAGGFARGGRSPLLVVFAPASPAARADSDRLGLASRMEAWLADATRATPGVHVVDSSELFKTYPVAEYYDRESDILGHVPYTPAGFAALGTLVVRRIWSLVGPPYKVVVVTVTRHCGRASAEKTGLPASSWMLRAGRCRKPSSRSTTADGCCASAARTPRPT